MLPYHFESKTMRVTVTPDGQVLLVLWTVALLLLVLVVAAAMYKYTAVPWSEPAPAATVQQVDYCAARGASVVFVPDDSGLKAVCAGSVFDTH